MNMLDIPATRLGRIRLSKVLVVGFEGETFKILNKYKNGSNEYSIKRIDSSFKAYHWLLDVIVEELPERQPRGILCDLQFLIDDNFRFVDRVVKHPILRDIPFIVISTNGTKIDPAFALRRGIDDCFPIQNLQWNDVKRRIEFLVRFKPEIVNGANGDIQKHEVNEYRIETKKRIFDIVFASVILLALSPIILLIALLIKLESRGPVFYLSKRAGVGFHVFDFIKFRSMYQDADQRLKDFEHLNQYKDSKDGVSFVKLQNDPRVTRVGKFIRKTSLDELPQLINVLKGDMSIVGNRPLPLYEAEQLTSDEWAQRFIAPAGLTGLWQISKRGKSDMSTQERIKLDIDYANKYSMRMDLKILLKTLPAMIQEEQV